MEPQELPLRQILQHRLEFIEFRLLWDGQINRSDLMAQFGISPSQASADLRQYQELAGVEVAYDVRQQAYVPGPAYRAVLLGESAETYLAQLPLLAVRSPSAVGWIGKAPPFDLIQRGRRSISSPVLRTLLDGIRGQRNVEVHYQSLSGEQPKWRLIAPHALVNDTFRWHVRAWCYERKGFRDFVIPRMLGARGRESTRIAGELDDEWVTNVVLKISPHPGLSEHEKKAVALDYNMSSGEALLPSRVCLVRYIEWQLRLDVPRTEKPVHSMQVVLVNREEVEGKCSAARVSGARKGLAVSSADENPDSTSN